MANPGGPRTGRHDIFEQMYMAKFGVLVAPYGVPVDYPIDRAGLDKGVHLRIDGVATQTRVWFQAKGLHEKTLSLPSFRGSETVLVEDLPTDYIRYWYAHPEATYLLVYIESADVFLAEDIRDIADRMWPGRFYDHLRDKQTVTLKVSTGAVLSPDRIEQMLAHRSMRIDGPSSRGRPLGHRFDPLRCRISSPAPTLFDAVVSGLLTAHRFEQVTATQVLPHLRVVQGTLRETMTWQPQLFTEFGYDRPGALRVEGATSAMHGPVTFVLDVDPSRPPLTDSVRADITSLLRTRREHGDTIAILSNAAESEVWGGEWPAVLHDAGVIQHPVVSVLGLDSVTTLLLTATLVYLEFAPELSFDVVNYIEQ